MPYASPPSQNKLNLSTVAGSKAWKIVQYDDSADNTKTLSNKSYKQSYHIIYFMYKKYRASAKKISSSVRRWGKISGSPKINPTLRHEKSKGPTHNKLVCELCNELFNSHVISKLRNKIRNASLRPREKTTMYHYDSKYIFNVKWNCHAQALVRETVASRCLFFVDVFA